MKIDIEQELAAAAVEYGRAFEETDAKKDSGRRIAAHERLVGIARRYQRWFQDRASGRAKISVGSRVTTTEEPAKRGEVRELFIESGRAWAMVRWVGAREDVIVNPAILVYSHTCRHCDKSLPPGPYNVCTTCADERGP